MLQSIKPVLAKAGIALGFAMLAGCSNLAQEGCSVSWNVVAGGLITGTTSGSCTPVPAGTTVIPAPVPVPAK